MSSPAIGIKDLLVDAGVGSFAASSGWSIQIGRMSDDPDTQIGVFDNPGAAPDPGINVNRPAVQVLIRGKQDDYADAYTKAGEVRDALLGLPAQTLNGDLWNSVTMENDIDHAGWDQKNRPFFVIDFNLILIQGDVSNSHRHAL